MRGGLGSMAALMALVACGPAATPLGGAETEAVALSGELAAPVTVGEDGRPSRTCVAFSQDGSSALWFRAVDVQDPPAFRRWISLAELRLGDGSVGMERIVADELDDPNLPAHRVAPGEPNARARASAKLGRFLPELNERLAGDRMRPCQEAPGNAMEVTVRGGSDPVIVGVSADGAALTVRAGGRTTSVAELECQVDDLGGCSGPMEVLRGVWSAEGVKRALVLTGVTDAEIVAHSVPLP